MGSSRQRPRQPREPTASPASIPGHADRRLDPGPPRPSVTSSAGSRAGVAPGGPLGWSIGRVAVSHEPAGLGEAAAGRDTTVPDVLRSSGRPLDASLRQDMEARLGADFADVRVHSDAAAQRSAAEVGARAYTSGNHVVIGQGSGDRHTFAHELTHVIQQRSGAVAGTDHGAGLKISDPDDHFEREAAETATRVMSVHVP